MRVDARIKLGLVLAALLLSLAARQPVTPLLIAAFALASLLVLRGAERRLLPPLGALAAAVGLPVLLVWLYRGPGAALVLGARVAGASTAGLWLVSTTDVASLEAALAWLRVPRVLVELLGVSYRQVHALREAAATARESQALRLGYAGVRRGLRSAGTLAGFVVGRAVDRSRALADSLALRGYTGDLPVRTPAPLGGRDAFLALGGAASLAVSALAGVIW